MVPASAEPATTMRSCRSLPRSDRWAMFRLRDRGHGSHGAARRCAALGLKIHEVLGLRDLSRTDMIVNQDGEPVFLEVNVAPGMTETSAVPLAIEAAGWSLGKMCADLVRGAAARSSVAAVSAIP